MNKIQLTSWEALGAGITATTKKMAKWLVTTPAGWAILASTAILSVAKAYNTFSESAKKAREIEENHNRLNSSVEELQETNSRLEQVNSELETTKTRIQELLKLESPTLVDKQELADLQKKNSLLLQQQQVLKASQSQQSKEVAENTSTVLNESRDRRQYEIDSNGNIVKNEVFDNPYIGKRYNEIDKTKINNSEELDSSTKEQANLLINEFNQLVNAQQEAGSNGEKDNSNLLSFQISQKYDEIKNILGKDWNNFIPASYIHIPSQTESQEEYQKQKGHNITIEKTNKEYINDQIERYNQFGEDYKNAILNNDTNTAEILKKLMNQLASDQLTWMGELSEEAKGYLNDDGSIKQGYEEEYNEWVSLFNDMMFTYAPESFASTVQTALGTSYSSVLSKLQNDIANGLTADAFKSDASYSGLFEKLTASNISSDLFFNWMQQLSDNDYTRNSIISKFAPDSLTSDFIGYLNSQNTQDLTLLSTLEFEPNVQSAETAINKAKKEIEKEGTIQSSFSDYFTEAKKEEIKDYKSEVDALSSYLQKAETNALSAEDKLGLLNDYGISADSMNDYADAIKSVMDAADDDILSGLEKAIENAATAEDAERFTDLKNIITGIGNESENASGKINTLFGIDTSSTESITSDVERITDSILNAKEEIKENGKLSSASIADLETTFRYDEEALSAIQKYHAGLIEESDLLEVLNKKYKEVEAAYSRYMAKQYENSEWYYNDVIKKDSGFADEVSGLGNDNYQIELENFSSIQALKELAAYGFTDAYEQINDDNINKLADKYEVDLENFKTKEEQKLAVAKAMADSIETADGKTLSGEEINKLLEEKKAELHQLESTKYTAYDPQYENKRKTLTSEVNTYQQSLEKQKQKTRTIEDTMAKLNSLEYNGQKIDYTNPDDPDGNGTPNTASSTSVFDWLQTRLEALSKATDRLKAKAENYISYVSKNKTLNKAIRSATSEINAQSQAYSNYLARFHALGLSEEYRNKIRNGSLDIETMDTSTEAGKALADKISEGQELWDKIQGCNDSITTLTSSLKDLNKQKLDNIVEYFDNISANSNAVIEKLAARLAYRSVNGDSSVSSYQKNILQKQKQEAEKNLATLQKKKSAFEKELNGQYKSGSISKSEYQNGLAQLDGMDKAIWESKTKIKEYENQIDNIPLLKLQQKMATLETAADHINAVISLREAKGLSADETDYKNLISNSRQQQKNLEKQNEKLRRQQSGLHSKTSDEYLRLEAQIEANNKAINEASVSQAQWNNEMLTLPIDRLSKTADVLNSVKASTAALVSYLQSVRGTTALSDFTAQMSKNEGLLSNLRSLKAMYQNFYNNALKSNGGVYGGRTWQEWRIELNNVDSEMYSVMEDNEKLKDSIRTEKYTKPFEALYQVLQKVESRYETLGGLINSDMLFDKNGNFTEYGLASLSTQLKNLTTTQTELGEIEKQLRDLDRQYADREDGLSETEYEDKRNELLDQYQSKLSEVSSLTNGVSDIMKQHQEELLDSLKKEVDARKEALQSLKDYYDYDKTIREKSRDINAIKAQIAATEALSDSLEKRRKLAELQSQLDEKENDLADTKYEHQISLISEGLDDMVADLEEGIQDIGTTSEKMLEVLQNAKLLAGDFDAESTFTKLVENLLGGNMNVINGSSAPSTNPDRNTAGDVSTDKIWSWVNSLDAADSNRISRAGLNTAITEYSRANNLDRSAVAASVKRELQSDLQYWKNVSEEINRINLAGNEIDKAAHGWSKWNESDIQKKYPNIAAYITDSVYTTASNLGTLRAESDNAQKNIQAVLNSLTPFHTGGIVGSSSSEVPLIAAKNETMLTQDFTKMLPQTVEVMKDFIQINTADWAKNLTPNRQASIVNHYNYDSLINVEGNVDKTLLPDLQAIVKESFKYSQEQNALQLRKLGVK